jgi:ligand-binding sensor domain-containing protein/signal transduction histidine kinase
MLPNNLGLWALPVSLSLAISAHAQNHPVRFEHLTLQDGLSQTTVSAIAQDNKGYLWFGTPDGLNKYDGYNFVIYRNDPLNPNSISDDWTTSIYEDKSGTLWIGTAKGVINRYNEEEDSFTHYRLFDNTIKTATEGSSFADAPFLFSFFDKMTITAICEDVDNEKRALWVGTWGCGLFKLVFSPQAGNNDDTKQANAQIIHYQHDPANSKGLSNNRIYSLCRDHSGRLWIGTFGGGVNCFNKETETVTSYRHDAKNPNSLSDDRILSIYEDHTCTLWIGTWGGGLNKLVRSPAEKISQASGHPSGAAFIAFNHPVKPLEEERVYFVRYRHDPSNPRSLSDNDVTAIIEDTRGTLWLGTLGGGLDQFDSAGETFVHYKHDRNNPYSLGSNEVVALYKDKSGIIWIGSQLGSGLSKLDRNRTKFTHYQHDPGDPNSLSDNIIWAIHEDSKQADGNIFWIGTYGGGLNRFDRKANKFTYYQHNPSDRYSLSQNHVRAICEDDSGALWIGTFSEGLNLFDRRSGRFRHYKHDPSNPGSLSDNQIRSIYRDRFGALWVGTFGGGLNKLEKEKKGFIHYRHDPTDSTSLSSDYVYCIYQDRSGTLWVGTFGAGLNRLVLPGASSLGKNGGVHHQREQFVRYVHDPSDPRSLGENRVLSIYEDRAGTLWAGTAGGGLNRFDRANGQFTRITEKDGLPSDMVYGILEDDYGNLWLSTNNGLTKFNPRDRSFKNYDECDGLQSKEFSGGAYHKSRRGEMFVGGVNGFNGFFPDSIKNNFHLPAIVISTVKKFDEVIQRKDKDLELSYEDNYFSIEFAALDYSNPAKNQYAYMLDGFDKRWNYCGTRRFASYTNLDPGEYIFRVKGSNDDGVWNEAGASMKITIHPPFWKTGWFLFSVAVSIIFAALFLHNYRVKYKVRQLLEIERIRREENERLRKQVARDFHDELGQRLTNIFLFTEILKRSLNGSSPQARTYLNKIIEASRGVSFGIRDFIWTLDPQKDSLYDVVIRLKDFADELFAKTGIDFRVTGLSKEMENVTLSMDWRRHLSHIFKEGMSHVVRHSACKNVTLAITLKNSHVEISLTDDGKGRDMADSSAEPHLLDMKKRADKIHGEVNIISRNGNGTTLQFKGRLS